MDQVCMKRGEGGDIAGRVRVDALGKDVWARAAQSTPVSHPGSASMALPPSPVLHYGAEKQSKGNSELVTMKHCNVIKV